MGLTGIFTRDSLTGGLARAGVVLHHQIEDEVLRTAIEALDYAQANAPWADRTGDARAGLDTDVYWEGPVVVWDLFHTVDYGLYLETRWNGELAIIMPTLEMFAPRLGQGLSESGDFGGG